MSTETLEETIEKLKMVIKELREENNKFINKNRDLQDELLPTKERLRALRIENRQLQKQLMNHAEALNVLEILRHLFNADPEMKTKRVICWNILHFRLRMV